MAALDGLRVLDLSTGIAGGFCTRLLGDFGADVVKVESPSPTGGLRSIGPFANRKAPHESGALHLYLNASKRSLVLNTASPTGRQILHDLLAKADVLVDDREVGALARDGFPPEQLAEEFPRLVVTLLSAFGQTGPYATAPATNLTSFATGGQMASTGDPDREPLKTGGYQADYQLGLNGFTATLAGLWAQGETGIGDTIDVSAMECMASTLEIMLNTYCYLKMDYWLGRKGNVLSGTLGLYPCEDGYLGVHAMPRNFPALARLMDAEWMLEDERFHDNASRLANDDELRAHVYAWALTQKKKEAYKRAGEIRAPVAYVHEIPDLLDSPHLKERGYFQRIEHPVAGTLTYPGPVFRMSETPAEPRRAPLLGEHTDEVLAERLGLGAEDIDVLRGSGVI